MKSVSLYNKIFFIFIFTSILSIGGIFWYGLHSTSKSYISSAYDMSDQHSASLEAAIEDQLAHVPKDVMYAKNFYALKKFLLWRSIGEERKAKKWKTIFLDAVSDFLYTKKDYYQARVIDLEGNEVINTKYIASIDKTVVVDESQLQNRKTLDYVQETKKLQEGEFYVSAMNLNQEHGHIEKPYIPVVRFSTPIMGSNNQVIAVYVVNYYAEKLLNMIKKENEETKKQGVEYYLVDTKGNYLFHEDKLKRWGSQLQNGFNFNKEHFSLKEHAQGKKHGSFSLEGKMYSFHEVYPLEKYSNRHWYIISSIDEELALVELEEFKYIFIIIACLVILFNFFLIRAFIKNFTNPLTLVSEQLLALSFGEIKKEKIHYKSDDEIGRIVKSTQQVVGSIEKVIKRAKSVASGEVDQGFELLGENDRLGVSMNEMIQRLQEIESLAQNLSIGNYDTNIVARSSNDKLGIALLDMIAYLESITNVAESVAKGKIDLDYKAVSSDDRLGIAMIKMVSYLKTIFNQANAIAKEDFSQNLRVKSNDDELGRAMVLMTNILSENYIKNKDEVYFSEGIAEFSDEVAGIENTKELATKAISIVCRYINAVSGVVYTFEKDTKKLNLETSFAYEMDERRQQSFELGEKAIGQVGLDQKYMLLTNVMDDIYSVSTGATISTPKEVFIFPLVYEGVLLGVTEVISFEKFNQIQKDYLLKTASIFAASLNATIQSVQIKTLLERSQRAFEELQSQSEELQESNVQMEEQQQQLTVQSQELKIKNDTLAKAKEEIDQRAKDLEKASQYKSEFLANMSHELRTPLNSIILLSKLLSQNPVNTFDEKDVEKSKVINKAGNDLLVLINDILDLSKIESGNMELNNTDVFSGTIIKNMENLFAAIAQEKNISLIMQDEFNASFSSDEAKLEQVLKNLLSNALKFTKKGSVSLSIKADENNIKFIVSDTGMGVPEDKLQTIFEAFKQVDGSISREFGGTGLGLSISTTIVKLMNGTLEVESELTKGAEFTVTLPLDLIQKVEKKSVTENTLGNTRKTQIDDIEETFNPNELDGKNILIVDDDSRNIFTLTSTLENIGAEVFSAFNGKEAVDLLEEGESIDLILMDIMMPVMDGIEAIKTIKASEQWINIPIIALTAKTMQEDKQLCLDAGANDYLAKPLDHKALSLVVKAWIK
ncbi:ATP-binding protein [Sulfurimonas sp.]|nr:ATP-binding protein [Sulfurimonas sp.]